MKKFLCSAVLSVVIWLTTINISQSQNFSFGNGPIPMGATTCFNAVVSGVGVLVPPPLWSTGLFFLRDITLNITTNHPHTMVIWVISPSTDTLLLSAYNGGGGVNFTNTRFVNQSAISIDGQMAPFTGNWQPEGGPLSLYDYTIGDGVWTICIKDTASAGNPGPGGPGGPWTGGVFGNGSSGGAAIGFGGGAGPLPVQLIGFEGKAEKKHNAISWVTASEVNNDHFDLERSLNGYEFIRIATVEGHGTTSQQHTYKYDDNQIENLNYYYRLRQTDYNGDFEYSEIILVKRDAAVDGFIQSVSPNPFWDYLSIIFTREIEEEVTLEFFNLSGKSMLLEKLIPKGNSCTVDVSKASLAAGTYLLRVSTAAATSNFRVIKK